MEYVTAAELSALLGAGARPDRVQTAVDAANQLIGLWSAPDPTLDPPLDRSPAQRQAGLELGHALYERHGAVGGVFNVDEIIARLPADLVRPIRDLLDADSHSWGLA